MDDTVLKMMDSHVSKCATILARYNYYSYDDARQELFLILLEKEQLYDPEGSYKLKPYLMSNLHFAFLKLQSASFKGREKYLKEPGSIENYTKHIDTNFEDRAVDKVYIDTLTGQLSPVMKKGFQLKVTGLSYDLIAHLLNLPTTTFKRKLAIELQTINGGLK